MRLQQDVRSNDFIFEFRMLVRMPGVVGAAHVIPGPAIEAALLNVSNVVWRQIISQAIAFVH